MKGLDRLLRPRSIAVVGGGAWAPSVVEQCQKIGFDGEIWPVHPSRAEVGGLPAYKSIQDLPSAPDASFVGVNRNLTVDVVRDLAARGGGGATCFASGFSEAQAELEDGASLQDELLRAAEDFTILGPNCYGFVNYLDRVAIWPDQHGGVPVDKGVAIVMQSSNVAINLTMQKRGLPIAYMVAVGNQAQTGMSDVGFSLLQDDRVTALGLHIEGIDDLRSFEALANEARRLGKPIVALKVGKSEQAQAATVSHTASLAGSDAGARALLARLGIAEVHSVAGFLEALKLLHIAGPMPSNRIAAMSCSGGEASLMADSFVGSRATYPALTEVQKSALRAALGPKVALANPLDYHTYIWADEDAMTSAFSGMMVGDLSLGIVVLDFPRADRCDAAAWDLVINAVARTKAATGKTMAILSSLAETMPEAVAERLVGLGIVPLCGMTEAVEAIDAAITACPSGDAPLPLALPLAVGTGKTLTEAEAKAALAEFGLTLPKSGRAFSPEEAGQVASEIGFPVVLKGEGIAHKTEAGAVVLGLSNASDVMSAADAMPCQSFLVEQMITDTVAELLIGVVTDPAHGYVLTIGAGGMLTELLSDSVSLLVPSDRESVRAAITNLKIWPLIKGYRNRPAADLDALLDAVMAVQDYVVAARPIEVEMNPLMCGPNGAIAADALIQTKVEPDE